MKEYFKKITGQTKECTNKVCTKIADCWRKIVDKFKGWWEWNWPIVMFIFVSIAIFGFVILGMTRNEKRKAAEKATWEQKENFVKRQGRYYIYREEIEGHQYYIYKFENKCGYLQDWQVVPVNYCEEE